MQLTSVKKEKLQKSPKYSVPEGTHCLLNTRRNLFYVVLLKDFSNNIWHKINEINSGPAINEILDLNQIKAQQQQAEKQKTETIVLCGTRLIQ